MEPLPSKHVALFTGQGIPSGQLAELRRLNRNPSVKLLIARLNDDIAIAVRDCCMDPRIRRHLVHGLNITSWAESAAQTPLLAYIDSVPIALVLTHVVQLAAFYYVWMRAGAPHLDVHVDSAAGHSQGLAAAMVVACATDVASFVEFGKLFGRILLRFGLAVAEALQLDAPSAPPSGACAASSSFALAMMKLEERTVRELAQRYSEETGEDVTIVVRNGRKAFTLTGSPLALHGFQTWCTSHPGAHGAMTKLLPVYAPFHSGRHLAEACDACVSSIRGAPEGTRLLSSDALRRPLFSCVDGINLQGTSLPCLCEYLLRALAERPVDWPCAVRAIAAHYTNERRGATRWHCTDYGPGGGSGAARMTRQVMEEDEEERGGAEEPVARANGECRYYTQIVVPGKLPQSWLTWLKLEEAKEDVAAEKTGSISSSTESDAAQPSAQAHRIPGSGGSPFVSATKAGRGFEWFSERLKHASKCSMAPRFTPEVLEAIEPELSKVRAGREVVRRRVLNAPDELRRYLESDQFQLLRSGPPRTLTFDTNVYDFAQCFRRTLQLAQDIELDRLHERCNADRGERGNRKEKAALMRPLTDPDARGELCALYERFVCNELAPWLHKALGGEGNGPGCDELIFQAFPCIRVHRPSEFSIGPHCDAQYYGESSFVPDGTINMYMPLTARIDHTNSLYVESEPGREDFRPLALRYGELATFYGVYCCHFAVENLTESTRVSLDFRVVPASCFHAAEDEKDFVVGKYYSMARRVVSEREDATSGSLSYKVSERGTPYWRHGFPHTNK